VLARPAAVSYSPDNRETHSLTISRTQPVECTLWVPGGFLCVRRHVPMDKRLRRANCVDRPKNACFRLPDMDAVRCGGGTFWGLSEPRPMAVADGPLLWRSRRRGASPVVVNRAWLPDPQSINRMCTGLSRVLPSDRRLRNDGCHLRSSARRRRLRWSSATPLNARLVSHARTRQSSASRCPGSVPGPLGVIDSRDTVSACPPCGAR